MELTLDQALQQGIEAHKAGQVQEADRLYTAILKALPKHPDANHNMGVLAVGVGKVQEALPFFKTALEANPGTAQFWLSYIDALINLGHIANAKAVFKQAKEKGAKGDGFDQTEQRLNLSSELSTDAVVDSKDVKKDPPNILDTLKLDQAIKLAKEKSKKGSYDEAKLIYQDILVRFPKNNRAIDGIRYLKGGRIAKAPKAQDPPQNQLQPIINHYNQGRLQNVLDQVLKLQQKFPDSFVLHSITGATNAGLGQLDAAIESYNKALSIKPDYASLHLSMGNALKSQGKLKEAIAAYNNAIASKPDFAEAYNNMGVTLKDQGKLAEAAEAYNKALSIKPAYAEAYNNTGITLHAQGKLDEATEAYEKALAINPDYAEAYNNIGVTLQEQTKLEEAIEAYSKALAIIPNYVDAYFNMGITLQDQGKLKEAIEVYKKALAIKPDYADVWYNIVFPLQAIKTQISSEQELASYCPENKGSAYTQISTSILNYRLYRGGESAESLLNEALKLLANAKNLIIKNPSNIKDTLGLNLALPEKVIGLTHFGRSGTGLLHSLIDGHPDVSTLPSIYFSEYFNHSTWENIISDGWNNMANRFMAIYDVLFDASSSVPIETKSKKLIYNIGQKEGMINVGDQRNEVLLVDKGLFHSELKQLMNCYDELDIFTFFRLVNAAYDKAINDLHHKSLIFYHIHNPDTYAQLNFLRSAPNSKWLMMVREPIQSCESWSRKLFLDDNYNSVSNCILTMLFEIDNIIYHNQNSIGVRLEDIKERPRQTIPALCKWMGIDETESLYEMTAQGKKWWGDPVSPDYTSDGMNPFGRTSINRKLGSVFSENDQFVLRTLFYPFSVRFGYVEENFGQFKIDLQAIRPMLEQIFDFEKTIVERTQANPEQFMKSGSYLCLRSGLIERWNILNKFHTYPNMITPLTIN